MQYLEKREESSRTRVSSEMEMGKVPPEVEMAVLNQLVMEGDREVLSKSLCL